MGVQGNLVYNGRLTVLANSSWNQFVNSMNNMNLPFSFDHAVAVMEYKKFIKK